MSKEEAIKICEQVAEDVERDAKEFDGQPFTGKTIGTYLGYHGAAIEALATILKNILENPSLCGK